MNNVMLSRVAESIYWMSRYVERAENTARFVDVNLQLTLDRTGGFEGQWESLVDISGEKEAFYERYDEPTRQQVLAFLTLDETNPNSIVSCVNTARESARTVRDTITTEMWEQMNQLYHLLRRSEASDLDHGFFRRVKLSAMLFTAICDNTQSRGAGWRFGQLGRMTERADMTSRILDVKYFLLLPSPADVGSNIDVIQWRALLHSTDALEMYRQTQGTITPGRVAAFLILDRAFPRSLAFCLEQANQSLESLMGHDRRPSVDLLRRRLGGLRSELEFGTIDELIASGLHEYLDAFQGRLIEIGAAIHESFFQPRALASDSAPDEPTDQLEA